LVTGRLWRRSERLAEERWILQLNLPQIFGSNEWVERRPVYLPLFLLAQVWTNVLAVCMSFLQVAVSISL
jgi:hypothetical protein